jgi:hypothetical protein
MAEDDADGDEETEGPERRRQQQAPAQRSHSAAPIR